VLGRGFDAMTDIDHAVAEGGWVDASEPAESEISAAATQFDFSESVRAWLTDANRSTRAQLLDGALVVVLNVPKMGELQHSGANDVVAVSVVVTDTHVFTAHDSGADGAIAAAASNSSCIDDRPAKAVLLAVIDQITERYATVLAELGNREKAHATRILDAASGGQSAKSVVATGLRLAIAFGDIELRLRELRQTIVDVRNLTVRYDDSVTRALETRLQTVKELDADLDSMNHRLELTTDAQLSLLSSRQGEINKRIGAWAAVIGVDAVITGWYGMNIRGLPGAGSWVTVAILMASITVVLIIWFRRIDWL
jgi:magnesium transporter